MAKNIDELKNRLNKALNIRNMKPLELSQKTGIPKSSISQYMSGYTKPKDERVYYIAKALDVSEAWLMGFNVPMERDAKINTFVDSMQPNITDEYTTFPVIGEVAAGYNHFAVEDWTGDTIDVPDSWILGYSKSDFFVLQVIGDSMFPEYRDGDKVLVRRQNTMDYSGQVGVVIYESEISTIKRVEYNPGENWVRLTPINPTYPQKLIVNEDLESFHILGIPVKLIRDIKYS